MGQYFKAYDTTNCQTIEHSYISNFGLDHACKCQMMQDIEIAGVVDEVAAANSVNAAAILLVGDYGVCLWYDPGNGINRVDLMYDDVPKLNTIFEQVWG